MRRVRDREEHLLIETVEMVVLTEIECVTEKGEQRHTMTFGEVYMYMSLQTWHNVIQYDQKTTVLASVYPFSFKSQVEGRTEGAIT